MADEHEDEDVQRIKNWWRANGASLVIGVVVGLAVIVGWQGWQAYVENQALAAADLYQQFAALQQSGADDQALVDLADELQSDYGSSPYAAKAGLALGRHFAQAGDNERARQALQWVIDYADQTALRHLARVRQARLIWGDGDAEAALAQLDTDHPDLFAPLYAELAGDIHAAGGDRAAARQAYQRALDNLPADADPAALQRKLADVAPTRTATAEAP